MLRASVMLNALNAVYLTLLYVLTRLCIVYKKIIKKNEAERHHLVQQANDWVATCDAQKEEYENKHFEMEAHHRVQIHEKDIKLNKQKSDNLALANKLAETEEYFSEFVARHAAELGLLNVGNEPHGASFHQNILNAASSPAGLGGCIIVNPDGDENVKGSTASPNSSDRQIMHTKIPRIVKQSGDPKIVKLADDETVKGSTASPKSPDRRRTPTKIPRIVKQSGDHKIIKLADDENVKRSTASPNSPDHQQIPTKIPRIVKDAKDANMEDTVLKLSIQERPRPRFNGPKRITYKKVDIPCSEGAACMRRGCEFTHLSGKLASKKIQCRFGSSCRKTDCLFQHGYF